VSGCGWRVSRYLIVGRDRVFSIPLWQDIGDSLSGGPDTLTDDPFYVKRT